MDILYTVSQTGCAVFAERELAVSVGRIRRALDEAATWGEFRTAIGASAFEELAPLLDDGQIDHQDDLPFVADDIPGHADGDYPQWLQQTMLEWFPAELVRRFGTVEDSALNGECLDLPGEAADEIAEALRALGHQVERTDLPLV